MLFLVRHVSRVESTCKPRNGVLWLALLQETVAEQVSALKEPAVLIVRPRQVNGVLKFADRFFHQAHLLVRDGHLVMRVVVIVRFGRFFTAFEPELRTDLVDAERVGGNLYGCRLFIDG